MTTRYDNQYRSQGSSKFDYPLSNKFSTYRPQKSGSPRKGWNDDYSESYSCRLKPRNQYEDFNNSQTSYNAKSSYYKNGSSFYEAERLSSASTNSSDDEPNKKKRVFSVYFKGERVFQPDAKIEEQAEPISPAMSIFHTAHLYKEMESLIKFGASELKTGPEMNSLDIPIPSFAM